MDIDKNKMMMAGGGVLFFIILVGLFFLFRKKSGSGSDGQKTSDDAQPTIYGTLGCPYTVKQMQKYPKHTFVDCSTGGCPSFVTAYPTTKWSDGRTEVGFS
jgi:hypothetical protein